MPAEAAPVWGLRGFTHNGGILMTLMSPAGASALAARLAPLAGEDLLVEAAPGTLPVVHEVREGALEAVIEALAVEVVDFARWNALKQQLGDAALR